VKKRLRFRSGIAAIVAALALAVGVAPAGALSGGELASLATEFAAPWPALQNSEGRFFDSVSGQADGHGRYGEAMLGVALMETGLQGDNQALITAGLRGVGYAVRDVDLQARYPSVFENFALASGYNTARARLAGDPRFETIRDSWEDTLRRIRPIYLYGRASYWNKSIVEAAAVLELHRTGLRSSQGGAWLANRPLARRRATDLVNRIVPSLTGARGRTVGGASLVLSDPPANPIAYHALSLGFYAHAVMLLDAEASRSALRTLADTARASWTLAGPDGDVAYVGRSQEQSWSLATTAYGAEVAARTMSGPGPARMRSLAARAVGRLRSAYRVTDHGVTIVPALQQRPSLRHRGLDPYAGTAAYNGLTILTLARAAALGVRDRPAGGVASDRGAFAATLEAGDGDMAVARSGPVWFAVKRRRSAADLRYDFGLVALKTRRPGGWTDVSPHRPRANGPSTGPTLLADGRAYEPYGRTLRAGDAAITVGGGFAGTKRRAAFRYAATACGVQLTFRARAGDRYRYSAFFRSASAPVQVGSGTVAGAGQRVSVNAPALASFTPGFASAVESDLVRADLVFAVARSGTVSVETCGT
jgi:hypothetical protein